MATIKIIEKEGWYSSLSYDTSLTEKQVTQRFLLNGMNIAGQVNPRCGMLITTDRWYNKSLGNGTLKTYYAYTSKKST
jgi:hypothetical protein